MSAITHAITLWQPWAWAVAHGGKRVENRPWPTPPAHVGTTIAIHAGMHFDLPAVATVRALAEMPPPADYVHGAVIAVARVAGCVTGSPDPWFAGPFGWLLEDVVPIEPVQCRGYQKLWRMPDGVAEAVAYEYEVALQGVPLPRGAR